ncbi:MAG: hypothetical protein KAJ01_02775 [Candidatus Hydrogenedentes bacterium]|nr:hypothetical protein [Candidatus Hydrogenedentota bacterium]
MNKRTVVLLGMAESRHHAKGIKEKRPDVEVWSLNRCVAQGYLEPEEIDRLYEVHFPWYIMGPWYPYGERYAEWLKQEHPFPIYMHYEHPEIPNSIAYPIEGVVRCCFPNTWRGGKKTRYLTSTFSYLAGHALYEHRVLGQEIGRIEVYGFEMKAQFEYAYQKPGAHRLLGQMEALDIEIWTPAEMDLFDAKLYGYEVSEMIPRQTFEEYKFHYLQGLEEAKAFLNHVEGDRKRLAVEFDEMRKNGASDEDLQAKADQLGEVMETRQNAFAKLHRYDTAKQLCEKFINMCDLQEVPPDFEQEIGTFVFEGYDEYKDEIAKIREEFESA